MRSVSLTLDNDILSPRGGGAPPDYDYTHGLAVSVALASPPAWMPPVVRDHQLHLGAGQRIYTPRRDAPDPVPGERPYAAWLYVAGELVRLEPRRVRSLGVEVGITGPAALGEPVQNGAHRLLGTTPQAGWAHQLGTAPGILVRYRDAWRVDASLPHLGTLRLESGGFAALGNVRTSAGAEAAAQLGRVRGDGLHARVEARGEWVARDLFLDGNTFGGNSLGCV